MNVLKGKGINMKKIAYDNEFERRIKESYKENFPEFTANDVLHIVNEAKHEFQLMVTDALKDRRKREAWFWKQSRFTQGASNWFKKWFGVNGEKDSL